MDIYAIIFLALAILIYLRLRSVLGQQTHQRRRIPVTGILLTLTAAALVAVSLEVGSAKRFPLRATAASTTAASTISGPARVIDGDTVVVAGTTVRLKGVDAAELGTARGDDARRVMAKFVTGELTCRLTGEKTSAARSATAPQPAASTSIARSSPRVPLSRARASMAAMYLSSRRPLGRRNRVRPIA